MKEILKRFWPYIKEYKFYYMLVVFGGILMLLGTIGTAHIMKPLMDEMFIQKRRDALYYSYDVDRYIICEVTW